MALGCGDDVATSAGGTATSDHNHHDHHHVPDDSASDCDCCADCGSACSGATAVASDLSSAPDVGLAKPPSPLARFDAIASDAHHSPLIRPPIRSI